MHQALSQQQRHKLGLVAVFLAGPLAQLVGVEEQLRPPTRLVGVDGLLLGLAAAAAVALELLLAVWLAVVSAGALGAPGTKHWASRRLRRCGKPELSWAKARSQILGFPYHRVLGHS